MVDSSVVVSAVVGPGATVGPVAYLRPGTVLEASAKAGTSVEIKNSVVGEGSKVPHLSYIGDATIGAGVNVGAGSITCNYDGKRKHATVIGDGAFIGSDTMLVAPVRIGEGAVTGAGSAITRDVPARRSGRRALRAEDARGLGRAQARERLGTRRTERASGTMAEHGTRMMVFSGTSNPELAEDVARELGVELGNVKIRQFANGEIYVRFLESVRGADVFLIQSVCRPVNDTLMELLIMVDAAKRASAESITAVIPHYGYARQDKKSAAREPITAKLVADLLSMAGVDRVITMDLHQGQIQGFFNQPVNHLTALPILADYFESLGAGQLLRGLAGRRSSEGVQEARGHARREPRDHAQGPPGAQRRRDHPRHR